MSAWCQVVRWYGICLKDPGVSPEPKSRVSWETVALAFCDAPVDFSDLLELTQYFCLCFIHLKGSCAVAEPVVVFCLSWTFSLLVPWDNHLPSRMPKYPLAPANPFMCTGKAPWHQNTGEFVCEPSLSGKSVGKMISTCCVDCCSWRRMISSVSFAGQFSILLADFSCCQRHM